MPEEDNLKTSLWGDFERTAADLFSPRKEARLDHGIGLLHIVRSQGSIDFTTHFVLCADRIALDQKGLVLVGNLSEFSADAERLMLPAGYPTRFEVTQADSGFSIVDHQDDSSSSILATAEEHVGLVFRGETQEVPGRPTLLFAGTSSLGIQAGTLWATHVGLADIPAPPGFPNSPIEALVHLLPPEQSLPALSDLKTVRLICGSAEYDPIRREWREAIRQTPIQVLTEGGEARVIFVGDRRIEVKETDLPRLLLLLIERSEKEKWTTIAQAQARLDREVLPGRYRTLGSRMGEIKRLSPDPNFLHTTRTSDGVLAFRLRSDIVFLETNTYPS